MTGPPEQRPSAKLRRSAAVGSTPLRAGHRGSPAPGTVLFPPERPAQVSQHQSPAQVAATLDPESCSWAAQYTSEHKERSAHGRQRSRFFLMHGMDHWVLRRHLYFLSKSCSKEGPERPMTASRDVQTQPGIGAANCTYFTQDQSGLTHLSHITICVKRSISMRVPLKEMSVQLLGRPLSCCCQDLQQRHAPLARPKRQPGAKTA